MGRSRTKFSASTVLAGDPAKTGLRWTGSDSPVRLELSTFRSVAEKITKSAGALSPMRCEYMYVVNNSIKGDDSTKSYKKDNVTFDELSGRDSLEGRTSDDAARRGNHGQE